MNDAFEQFVRHDSRKAVLVKLRQFAGLTSQEAADVLGIAESTTDVDWADAKSWLKVRFSG